MKTDGPEEAGRHDRALRLAGLVAAALAATAIILAPGCGEKRREPGVLTVGIATDVQGWSCEEFPGGDARYVWSQVYETLLRLTPDLEFVPGLALSWSSSEDSKTWEFELRRDIVFHDGTPLTAEAVIFSYGRNSYSRRTVLRPVESIEAKGPHTVRFKLKRPMPLPYYLSHVAWPIMGPGCMDAQGRFIRPVGTGPFRFERQLEDQEIVLTRNEDYWNGPSRLERVTFKVIPDAVARIIALEAGDLDMTLKVPESDVGRLQQKRGITVHRKVGTFTDFIQFNCLKEPFSDVRLRRAVARAIDTETLVEAVLEGVGMPARGRPLSPTMLYFDPDLPSCECDHSEARRLLAEAGWQDSDGDGIVEKDGRALRGVLLVSADLNVAVGGRFFLMAEAVQGALRDVGMDIQIKRLERGATLNLEKEGKFGMLMSTGFYVWSSYPRHFFLHHSSNPYGHFHNSGFDELITAADAAASATVQKELYVQLQQQTLEMLPAFYLVHQEKVVATGPRVRGYTISAETPWLNLKEVHLDR